MPQNKRESLIFTVMMCFFMVFFMSIYNVACHHGALNLEIVKDAWIGFPIAYCFAMCCDWFLVSGLAKGFAFRFLVKPESEPFKKAIAVSCCMVVPMVIIMSFYGAMEAIVSGLESAASDLDHEHSQKLYHGAAPAAAYRRPLYPRTFPEAVSGGYGAGLTFMISGAGWYLPPASRKFLCFYAI